MAWFCTGTGSRSRIRRVRGEVEITPKIVLCRCIMNNQRSGESIAKMAAVIAAPLECLWMWIFAWPLLGSLTTNIDGLAHWLWSLAFVIHIPGALLLAPFDGMSRACYWPLLFVAGFAEFWILSASVLWGWRTLREVYIVLRNIPKEEY